MLTSSRNQRIDWFQFLGLINISKKSLMLLVIWCRYHTNCCRKREFYLSQKTKKAKEISQETVDKLLNFIVTIKTSGKCLEKNFMSIVRRSHMQKCLILSNLKELYANFKSSYPDIKTCFSDFCSHCPK